DQTWTALPTDLSTAEVPHPGLTQQLEMMIDQSGVPVTLNRLCLIALAAGVLVGVAASWFHIQPIVAAILGGVGAILPFGYVYKKFKGRREAMLRQLPDAFELMSRVVRAGQSIPQAFLAVSEEFKGPIGTEFAYCFDQQNLGLPFDAALRAL